MSDRVINGDRLSLCAVLPVSTVPHCPVPFLSLSLSLSLSFKHFSLQRIGALTIVPYTLYIYGRSYVTGLRLSVVCTLRNVLWLNGAP